jgi:hypothetical protein
MTSRSNGAQEVLWNEWSFWEVEKIAFGFSKIKRRSNCARPPQPKGWGMLRAARFRLTGFQKHPNLRFPGSAHQNNCVLCARLHDTLLINLMIHEIPARVHFLPDLKVGVSVTLCTPFVMKNKYLPYLASHGYVACTPASAGRSMTSL